MKFILTAALSILTSCSSIRLKLNSSYTGPSGEGKVSYEKSYSTGSFPWICGATAIFFGGGCWAYMVMPMVPQENAIIADAQKALAEKNGQDVKLVAPEVTLAGWRSDDTTLNVEPKP